MAIRDFVAEHAMPLGGAAVMFTAFLVELTVSHYRRDRMHRADSLLNVKIGMIYVVSSALVTLLVGIPMLAAWSISPFDWRMTSPWHWVALVVLADFVDYWSHRASHALRVMWASHRVHHSSAHFNLSIGLRNSWVGGFLDWVLVLPLALAGFHPLYIGIVGAISTTWSFLSHAAYAPRLRILEPVFVTPRTHRIHHLRGAAYTDKNFGRVLCLWDRLLGTYHAPIDDGDFGSDPMPARPGDLLRVQFQGWTELLQRPPR